MIKTSELGLCIRCKKNKGSVLYTKSPSGRKKKTTLYFHCSHCNSSRARKYRKTHAEVFAKITKRYDKKNKIKRDCWTKVQNAINKKLIIKPNKCESCASETRLDGHHSDYSKPLDVKWLCRKCHIALHRKEKVV